VSLLPGVVVVDDDDVVDVDDDVDDVVDDVDVNDDVDVVDDDVVDVVDDGVDDVVDDLFFFFLVLFFGTGDRTQGLALPRQALCH